MAMEKPGFLPPNRPMSRRQASELYPIEPANAIENVNYDEE
jgi:hypothetical protein